MRNPIPRNQRQRGYALRIREPEWFRHCMFKGLDTDTHLHVFSKGAAEIDRMRRFRDHLRFHGGDRQLYSDKTRELAQRKWKYVQNYADAKSEIVEEIMRRAYPGIDR